MRTTDRPLASNAEAGRFARHQVRLIHRRVLRDGWRLWCLVIGALAVATTPAFLMTSNSFARGLVVGGMVVLAISSVAFLVVLRGGTAPLMMGELAEQWTGQSLRPLLDHGWHLAHHVLLSGGDVDHVLIGPGGVVVVETKWRREPWRENDRDREAALHQARDAARHVNNLLGGDVPVRPVVVLWTSPTPNHPVPTKEVRHGDVLVIPGDLLKAWALRRPRNVLDTASVERLWSALREQKLRNMGYEREHARIPMSFDNVAMAGLGLVVLLILGFLASAQVLKVTGSIWAWLGAALLPAVAVWVGRQHRGVRMATRAFGAGWAASFVLVLVVVVNAYMR